MDNAWDALESKCASCRACPLCETRRHTVFGAGPKNAKLMFIGEGPGEQEDIQGEPFVGAAGKFLDALLLSVGLDRSMCYIANIIKCRPPGNRDPLQEEQDACMPFLREQTALIKPKLIVALGRIAAARIYKPDFRVTREHGQWTERSGVMITATFHPSALLRSPEYRPDAFLDFKSIAEKYAEL